MMVLWSGSHIAHTHKHTQIYMCVRVCVRVCVHACVRVLVCVCVCVTIPRNKVAIIILWKLSYYCIFFLIRTLPFTLTFPNCHIINYLLLNIKSATCTNLYYRFYEDFYLMKFYTVCKPVFCLREDKQKGKGLPIKTKQ